jgi:hypothetical protein
MQKKYAMLSVFISGSGIHENGMIHAGGTKRMMEIFCPGKTVALALLTRNSHECDNALPAFMLMTIP